MKPFLPPTPARDKATTPQDGLLLKQMLVIILGLVAGLTAAFFMSFVKLDYSGDLQTAREMGIVSLAVLENYPKSRDIVTYLSLLLLPVAGSLSFWFAWSMGQRHEVLAELPVIKVSSFSGNYRYRRILLLLLMLCYFLVSLVCADIFSAENAANSWMFLGEEGENLAWVQCILQGGVYAKDFFCLYGPMLTYPLAWFMKLFGQTVLMERIYGWILDLLAFTIYLVILNRILRNRVSLVIGAIVYSVMFMNSMWLSPNATNLRVALGILPLYLLHRGLESNNGYLAFAAGVAVGQSLLFSQEVGVCSFVALGCMLTVHAFRERPVRKLAVQLGALCLGTAVSVLPMLFYLAAKGALSEAIKSLYLYPRLVMLGYGALPFPGISDFFRTPFTSEVFPPLWIIAVYITAATALTILLVIRRTGPATFFATGLLIFGILLFRSALGRSDIVHYMFVAPPAFILVFIYIDRSITTDGDKNCPLIRVSRWMGSLLAGVLILLTFTISPFLKIFFEGVLNSPRRLEELRHVETSRRERYLLDRSGVLFDKKSLTDFMAIRSFLDGETRPDDYVMFFPNEAAYYFLFNRRNPTRYAISYFAASSVQRREMVDDLERNKPEYVIYSLETWRVDDIPEKVQVPELVAYLGGKYEPYRKISNVLVMKRKKV
jgi:hypothetical protein